MDEGGGGLGGEPDLEEDCFIESDESPFVVSLIERQSADALQQFVIWSPEHCGSETRLFPHVVTFHRDFELHQFKCTADSSDGSCRGRSTCDHVRAVKAHGLHWLVLPPVVGSRAPVPPPAPLCCSGAANTAESAWSGPGRKLPMKPDSRMRRTFRSPHREHAAQLCSSASCRCANPRLDAVVTRTAPRVIGVHGVRRDVPVVKHVCQNWYAICFCIAARAFSL